jgi:hypothetical protein
MKFNGQYPSTQRPSVVRHDPINRFIIFQEVPETHKIKSYIDPTLE